MAVERAATQLETLHAMLATARELAADLERDPLLHRVLRVFLALPEADREPILNVLEKDAAWRRIVEKTAGATGVNVHPNPHASLYIHVLNHVTGRLIDGETSARDANVIRLGIETLVQLLPLLFQEGVHAQWTEAAREIIHGADVEARALGARLAREVLALIAAYEGADPAGKVG